MGDRETEQTFSKSKSSFDRSTVSRYSDDSWCGLFSILVMYFGYVLANMQVGKCILKFELVGDGEGGCRMAKRGDKNVFAV